MADQQQSHTMELERLLSLALQGIAGGVQEVLFQHLGNGIAFMLVVVPFGGASNVQYVANCPRPDAKAMLASLLQNFEADAADAPLHAKH